MHQWVRLSPSFRPFDNRNYKRNMQMKNTVMIFRDELFVRNYALKCS